MSEELYGKRWVRSVVKGKRRRWRYVDIPKQVDVLYQYFKPKSVLDVGASNGLHCRSFKDFGCYAFGIEVTKYFMPYLKQNASDCAIVDIRNNFNLKRQFELVHCTEVLEHVAEEYSDIAVHNILKHGSKHFFITASHKGRPPRHLNPQPRQYWVDKFLYVSHASFPEMKLTYRKDDVVKLQTIFKEKQVKPKWLKRNVMVFKYEY